MKFLSAVLLGIIVVLPIGYLLLMEQPRPVVEVIAPPRIERNVVEIQYVTSEVKPLEVGSQFMVKSCKVVDGFRFLILLENDTWIETSLAVITKEEATEKVAEFLKAATTPPTVLLKRKIDNYWVVDFEFLRGTEQVNLVDLLLEKDLVL